MSYRKRYLPLKSALQLLFKIKSVPGYIYKIDEKTKKYQLAENIIHHVKKYVEY